MPQRESRLLTRYNQYTRASVLVLVLAQVVGLVWIKVLTAGLSQVSFGFLSVMISIGALLGNFSAGFVVNGIWRYSEKLILSEEGSFLSGLIIVAIAFATVFSTVTFGLLLIFRVFFDINYLQFPEGLVLIAICATWLFSMSSSLFEVTKSVANGLQKARLIIAATLIFSLIQITVGIFFVLLLPDPVSLLIGVATSQTLGLFVLICLFERNLPHPTFERKIIKSTMRFSSPITLRNALTAGSTTVLLFFAYTLVDFRMSAIISLGLSAIAVFVGAVRSVFTPYRQYAIATHESMLSNEVKKRRISEATVVILDLLIIGAFWLFVLSPEIVLVLSSSLYLEAEGFIRIAVLGTFILWIGYIYGTTGIYLSEKTSFEVVSAALGFATVILATLAQGTSIGVSGFAYAYVLGCTVTGATNILFGTIVYGCTVPVKAILKIILACSIGGIVCEILLIYSSSLLLSGVAATTVYAILRVHHYMADRKTSKEKTFLFAGISKQ